MTSINFILTLYFIQLYHSQTQVFKPIYSTNSKYPFVLPYLGDYYYVITSNKVLKIDKNNGNIEEDEHGLDYSNNPIYCIDKSNNSYLYYSQNFYKINQNGYKLILQIEHSGNYFGSIAFGEHFAIYGLNFKEFFFIEKESFNSYVNHVFKINNNIEKVSCKYIEERNFFCARIIDKNIQLCLIRYKLDSKYYLNVIESDNSNQYINIGLYDTSIAKSTKILCSQKNNYRKNISCCFLNIVNYNNDNPESIERLGVENLTFIPYSDDFCEKRLLFF